jgi:hypothetical protein
MSLKLEIAFANIFAKVECSRSEQFALREKFIY